MNNFYLDKPEMLALWRKNAVRLGFTDFVVAEDGFKSVDGQPWQNSNATGVYFWIAENGEAYVGQAKKVRNRLLQHWNHHRDILEAAFQEVDQVGLDGAEQELIRAVGTEYPTRNIKFAIETNAQVPFDQFVSVEERKQFLEGETQFVDQHWREFGVLKQKQNRRFQRFTRLARFREILKCLRIYVAACIPKPPMTEGRFWSVTIFPQQGTFLRVNAGHQEVFTLIDDGKRVFARTLSRIDLKENDHDGPYYMTDSYAYFVDERVFSDWLNPSRIAACRDLVVWLMRHSTTLNNGSHCPQVVRAAFPAR